MDSELRDIKIEKDLQSQALGPTSGIHSLESKDDHENQNSPQIEVISSTAQREGSEEKNAERLGLMRKIYSIVSIQLLLTFVFSLFCTILLRFHLLFIL